MVLADVLRMELLNSVQIIWELPLKYSITKHLEHTLTTVFVSFTEYAMIASLRNNNARFIVPQICVFM